MVTKALNQENQLEYDSIIIWELLKLIVVMAMVDSLLSSIRTKDNGDAADDNDEACDILGWELVKRHFSVVAWTLWLCWRGRCLNLLLFNLSLIIDHCWFNSLIKGKWRWLHSGEDATFSIEHLWAPGRWEYDMNMMKKIFMRTIILSWQWCLNTWQVKKSNGDEMLIVITNGYYVTNTIIAL